MDNGEVVFVAGIPGLFPDELWVKTYNGESFKFNPSDKDIEIAERLCMGLGWWHDVDEHNPEDALEPGFHYASANVIHRMLPDIPLSI